MEREQMIDPVKVLRDFMLTRPEARVRFSFGQKMITIDRLMDGHDGADPFVIPTEDLVVFSAAYIYGFYAGAGDSLSDLAFDLEGNASKPFEEVFLDHYAHEDEECEMCTTTRPSDIDDDEVARIGLCSCGQVVIAWATEIR